MSSGSSVVVKISHDDKYSDGLKKMSTVTKAFNKDVDTLQAGLVQLSKNKAELKLDLKKAKKELADVEKDLKSGKASLEDFFDVNVKVDNITRNIRTVSKTINEFEKQISSSQNRANSFFSGLKQFSSAIAVSGIGDMAKDLMLNAGIRFAGSAGGDDAGIMASSILSSAASGAAMGMILPGVGNAVGFIGGALLGGLVGAANGEMQIYEKKDDFFKDYYNNLYEGRISAGEAALMAGSTTAGSREQSYKAFEKRLGTADADTYLSQVKSMAAQTNYGYDEILGYSKLLLNSYAPKETFGLLTTLSDATAGLGLNSSDVEMFIKGFSRMRTTGKVTQEYLNYFSERGVDVYEALARGTGADKSKIADMVTRGKIKGTDAAQAIVDFLNETYGGLSKELMDTYDAKVANLQDVQTNVEEGYGTGYNETRKPVVDAMTGTLNGALGEKLTWLNELTGSAQGYADNLKDSYWMDVMEAVFTGDTKLNEGVVFDEKTQAKVDKYRSDYVMALFRYDNAKTEEAKHKAALDMDRVRKQAEVLAGEVFGATDFNKALVDSQTDLITETRELAKKFQTWSDLYGQQQEKTKGQGGVVDTPDVSIPGDADGNGVLTRAEALAYANTRGNPTAWGLDYVPYDNYPALLHQGERVLTAQQAREADRGSGVSVVISGNEFHIREAADVDRVAEALLQKLELAAVRG